MGIFKEKVVGVAVEAVAAFNDFQIQLFFIIKRHLSTTGRTSQIMQNISILKYKNIEKNGRKYE